jgi:hypothetical protein
VEVCCLPIEIVFCPCVCLPLVHIGGKFVLGLQSILHCCRSSTGPWISMPYLAWTHLADTSAISSYHLLQLFSTYPGSIHWQKNNAHGHWDRTYHGSLPLVQGCNIIIPVSFCLFRFSTAACEAIWMQTMYFLGIRVYTVIGYFSLVLVRSSGCGYDQ